MMKTRKRIGAAFLAVALLIGQLGATAYAEGPPGGNGGFCEHHTVHDAAVCGYAEAIPGLDCGHEHTPECYTDELICELDENVEQAATGSGAEHQHGQECYALDCRHEHDDACGYKEAVTGAPCGYVCDQCGKEPDKDSSEAGTTDGNGLPAPGEPETGEPEGATIITVTAFDELDDGVKYQTAEPGTKLDDLTLPATLVASGYVVDNDTKPTPKPITINGVAWEPDSPWDETSGQGYTFTPVLPAGYALADAVELPEIALRIGVLSRAGTGSNDTNNDGYHDDDVAVINGIIDSNGLSAAKDDPESWARAGLVHWNQSTPRRLDQLNLYDKDLTGTLNVGGLTNLTQLNCARNQLTELKGLGSLTNLTSLNCSYNQLKMLDVGGLTSLTFLSCGKNQLDTLEGLDSLINLIQLSCSYNQLKMLDVGGLTNLSYLSCQNNQLDTLDVGKLTNLLRLDCYNNKLETLEGLGSLTNLTYLSCENNQLDALEGLGLANLNFLYCSNNKLKMLDIGKMTDLTYLSCDNNQLTGTLDVSGSPKLQNISYDGNSIVLRDGTIRAENGGKVKVQFGIIFDDLSSVDVPFTLTALPDSGYQFTGWTGLPNGVNHKDSSVSFTPGTGYIYTANFTSSIVTIPVTGVTLDQSAHTLYTSKDPRSFQLSATVIPANASNKAVSWQSSDSSIVTVDGNGNATAVKEGTAIITTTTSDGGKTAACTVTVETGTAETGSSGGSGRNHTVSTPQPPKPNTPVLAVIELPITAGGGTAIGQADDERTMSAIAEAQKDEKAGTNGIAVQYDVETDAAYDGFSITISRAILDWLIAAKVKYVTLNTGIVDLTLDLAALQEIQKQATGDITLTATRETGLAGDMLAAVGSRPAYRLSVNYTSTDGRAAAVQNFGAGRVTVGLAYKPAGTEQSGSLFLVYSADGKGAEWLYQSSYDRNSGNVAASTGHFSVYGVGCKSAPAFADTANHWARAHIDFAASRDLLAGTGDATFTPDGTATRWMFVMALGKLAGIDPAAYPSVRFTDVAATACYAPYVEWAASKGIITGTGETTFGPDDAITREQMAVIMQRYADKLGYSLPVAREAEIFADEGQITGDMKNAVQAMQQAGVMNGKGRRFGPKDTATRAEAAAVLRRFVEIIIDPAAAGGWDQNDAGRWLYYENNKPVTGWKQIDSTWYYFDDAGLMQTGGWREIDNKWYYFFPDGAMAVNTKIDGYELGPNGVRKENR